MRVKCEQYVKPQNAVNARSEAKNALVPILRDIRCPRNVDYHVISSFSLRLRLEAVGRTERLVICDHSRPQLHVCVFRRTACVRVHAIYAVLQQYRAVGLDGLPLGELCL